MDASPIPVSMRNDSALASRWFWSLCHGKPDDSGKFTLSRPLNGLLESCSLTIVPVGSIAFAAAQTLSYYRRERFSHTIHTNPRRSNIRSGSRCSKREIDALALPRAVVAVTIIPYYCTLRVPLINPSTNAQKSDISPVAALFPG